MKKIIILFCWTVLYSGSLSAQEYSSDTISKEAMKRLNFIIGNWHGEGWMMGRDGQKHLFSQSEKVQFKLDSMILLIEGTGKAEGQIIHNALAIVSYDKADSDFNFQSYLMDGRSGLYSAELIDDTFYWYPGENIRYIIKIDENGSWYEIGEMKRGEGWFQFFEMTLKRKNN